MQAAQRLATASAIDLAVARAHDPDARKKVTPITRRDQDRGAGQARSAHLRAAVRRHRPADDVTVDVASNSTFVLAYGYEADIDACEALYTSLIVQMVAASDAYLRSGATRARRSPGSSRRAPGGEHGAWSRRNRCPRSPRGSTSSRPSPNGSESGSPRPATPPATRRSTPSGSRERRNDRRQWRCATRNVGVRDFYRTESTARGTWRPSSASAGYFEAARRAGDRAGRRAKIGADREFGAPRGALEA